MGVSTLYVVVVKLASVSFPHPECLSSSTPFCTRCRVYGLDTSIKKLPSCSSVHADWLTDLLANNYPTPHISGHTQLIAHACAYRYLMQCVLVYVYICTQ